MTDQQFEQSFNSLHLGGGDGGQEQQFTTPKRPSGSGSLRSPNGLGADLPSPNFSQGSPTHNPQSAAARFERFFPSPGPPSSQTYGNNSMGSAAGLAANGAFGSFGHNLAPGTIGSAGGSGHFGSAATRKTPRAGLTSQWNADPSLSPSSGGSPPAGYYTHQPNFMGGYQQTSSGSDDDVIPTAIVVKNIPFGVKKEQLLQIIEDLAIPMPYAFNYHFDQGVFRGLAFANFRSSEEADAVVAALNGFDVSGRKLRVEYKKVLQAGEKERIEKEKAIKRMQSMQLEKERRRQDEYSAHNYSMPGYTGEQQQQGYGDATPLTADTLKAVPSSTNGPAAAARSEISGGAPSNSKKDELDLNDAATLEIYSRVLLFKDDRMRDELSFSRSLSPLERRTVHLVAQKLGLYHYSMGEGDERYVIVTKNEVPTQTRPLRSQASTIGRNNGARSGMLRMKKSAPDMKRMEGYNSFLLVPATVSARRSNTNLREGYSATMGRRPQPGGIGGAAGLQSLFSSPFDVPPVPSLGSDLPSPSTLRQPRGPSSSETGNFAHRKLNVTTHEPLEI